MAKDFGIVEPLYGEWHWPYRKMEEGDFFHVRYQDRSPNIVAQEAYVRASKYGMKFSAIQNDALKMIRVERVPFKTEGMGFPKVLDYRQLDALIDEQYEIPAYKVPWAMAIYVGETLEHKAKRVNPDARSEIVANVSDQRYRITLGDEKISAVCIRGIDPEQRPGPEPRVVAGIFQEKPSVEEEMRMLQAEEDQRIRDLLS